MLVASHAILENQGTNMTFNWDRPDNCDGTYQSSCDSSRAYSNISDILKDQGKDDLVTYMDKYWVDIDGDNESFWEHEWSKHGTCINTIEPSCYTDYKPQEEVGDFFQKVVDLFKTLDSYKALSAAGITPDDSKTYDLSDIEDALAKIHGGQKPYVGCDSGALNQLYYFYNIGGNAIDGQYKAVAPRKLNAVFAFALKNTNTFYSGEVQLPFERCQVHPQER